MEVILPRARSAREGAQILGHVVETKGAGEGFGVAFVDAKELWYLETGIREISLLRHRREVWCENRFSPIYQSGEPFSERVQTTENFGLGSYCRYFYFASCY